MAESRDELEMQVIHRIDANINDISQQETNFGGVKTVDDVFDFVHEWEYKILENSFRKNIQEFIHMRFDTTIKNFLNKNLIENKSNRGNNEYFTIVNKNIQNKSVNKIKIENKKNKSKVTKITENRILNSLTTLEQKLGKNNGLLKFQKNYKNIRSKY